MPKFPYVVLTIMSFIFLITSCQQTPKEVTDFAIKALQERSCFDITSCRDFKINEVIIKKELTNADKANRIENKWCIGLSYLKRNSDDTWYEDWRSVVIVKYQGQPLKIIQWYQICNGVPL